MTKKKQDPPIFTPDDEPYLGRHPLYVFDTLIISSLELNSKIAAYTHTHEQSPLQKAAAQIIPQGINLALSIRELIRQGHLFSAAVLLRSLIERVAIISYLRRNPEKIATWEDGWRWGKRPDLHKMLSSMSHGTDAKGVEAVCDTFNHLVHGDPMGAEFNLVELNEDALGYGVGRVTNNPDLCDFVCDQSICWLSVLTSMMAGCFPEAK